MRGDNYPALNVNGQIYIVIIVLVCSYEYDQNDR